MDWVVGWFGVIYWVFIFEFVGVKKVDFKWLVVVLFDYLFVYLIIVDDGYCVYMVVVELVLCEFFDGFDGFWVVVDVGLIGGCMW